MQVWSALALFAGLTTAASILIPDTVETQPYIDNGSSATTAVLVPEDAPADYHTDIVSPNESHIALEHLRRRIPSKKPRDTIAARDFYECATSGNPPIAKDCETVITNVYATNQAVVIASGACLLFQYNTCWGFFCSLCQRLGTDTNFIGDQLTTAQTLCVSGGAAGTVVGDTAPQWEAGFVHSSGALPNYAGDVC
ncbi:hypothetical protein F5Y08DRAFT_337709 [Xylaria arbuscula]|nr:hypothetical protein F5Y08DRAFT_337709 [Xylaria arbuscula]